MVFLHVLIFFPVQQLKWKEAKTPHCSLQHLCLQVEICKKKLLLSWWYSLCNRDHYNNILHGHNNCIIFYFYNLSHKFMLSAVMGMYYYSYFSDEATEAWKYQE